MLKLQAIRHNFWFNMKNNYKMFVNTCTQGQRAQVSRGSQVRSSEKHQEIATSTSELMYDFTTARPLDCIFSGMLEALAATCSDLDNALINSFNEDDIHCVKKPTVPICAYHL